MQPLSLRRSRRSCGTTRIPAPAPARVLAEPLERRMLLTVALSFGPPIAYGPTTWGPVTVGDLNGDGRDDMVVGDVEAGVLHVALADPPGRFVAGGAFPAGSEQSHLLVADFNADGHNDVVADIRWEGSVALLLGDGAGNLGPPATFPSGSTPVNNVAADFNKDGNLDLATAGWWSGGVQVFLGDGAGSFGPVRNFPAGYNTGGLVTADFNHDAKPDLAVSNWGDGTITVFLGDGRGGFATSTLPSVAQSLDMYGGDFDGDGHYDIAVSSGTLGEMGDTVSLMFGDGAGGFSPARLVAGPGLGGFYVADFNGDGRPDLVTRAGDHRSVSVLLNQGSANFAPPATFAVGERMGRVMSGDFNGDGKADVMVDNLFDDPGDQYQRFDVILNTTQVGPYEAERAAITGADVSANHSGFTGSGYVDFEHAAGDSVEFTVQAPSAGRYELSFRYANGGPAARGTGLWVNGAAVPGGLAFARTGSWKTWRDVTVAVPLAAGANTVRVLANGQSGPNLDSLSLRPVTPPASATYQAESAVLSGPLALSNVPGYTGTGFADYQRSSGDYVEFPIEVPADGSYALGFRYANGSSSDRPLELRVDGTVLTGRLSFAPTGDWRMWKTASQPAVLTAGRHAVRLTSVGSNGPNLDALSVAATVAPPPVEPVTLQAEAAALSGAVVGRSNGGYSGTGYADYQRAAGDYVEFAYDAPAVGDYLLEFRYANGSAANRPLDLRVNGAVARRGLPFAPTGSWSAWRTAAVTLSLPAGRNTIRLTAAGNSGPNLNALTVRAPTAVLWPVSQGGNGHYYERVEVPGGITWEAARAAAQARTTGGVAGHLLTINTQAELDFVQSSFPQALGSQHWLGGYQNRAAFDYSEPAGGWRWVTGEVFTFAPWSTPEFGGNDVEPNNWTGRDDFLATELSSYAGRTVLRFNDAPSDYEVSGYYVEYPVGSTPGGSFITPATGFAITWDGNEGESRGAVPVNLARADQGAVAFADHNRGLGDTEEFPGLAIHHVDDLNDGLYGNADSWISDVQEPHFAGVRFNRVRNVTAVAWGRDNGAAAPFFDDRWAGRYSIQVTTVTNPNAETPDSAWTTVGTVEYGGAAGGPTNPWLRHRYELTRNGQPIAATGLRLVLDRGGHGNGIDIDEIEAFGT